MSIPRVPAILAFVVCLGPACEGADPARDDDDDDDDDGAGDADADADGDADGDADADGDTDSCDVPEDEFGAIGECTETAPPESFEPAVQWVWNGSGSEIFSIVTPLVANLTDDDDSGDIDLCDTPDVVVVASSNYGTPGTPGHIYVLDGASGVLLLQFPTAVDHTVTPAIGDIDDDGLPEIVTAGTDAHLLAFEHDGSIKWQGDAAWTGTDVHNGPYSGAIALADLDEDGDVEIISGNMVSDHAGSLVWKAPQPSGNWSATTAADLDGEPGLEVVLGHAAYHADGTQYYLNPAIAPGYPQVADLDGDGLPEVLVTNASGISVLEHDGTTKYADLRPTGVAVGFTAWLRPATIHDFDGDGEAEYAMSSASYYTVYEADASIVWSSPVSDESGIAAGTAFDFLGDGTAEAMYADEYSMFIFDGDGDVLLETPRSSGTLSEYPVVADIDNDGSAEIVVVSNTVYDESSPTVQVIRDVQDRWIQARQIWNQHTYHVTNVRADGTIPQHEIPSWTLFNTFRTNIQIEDGALCSPPIE
jgi:hypothetical protein